MRTYKIPIMNEFYKFLESDFLDGKESYVLLDSYNKFIKLNDISYEFALTVYSDFLRDKNNELMKWIKRHNNEKL